MARAQGARRVILPHLIIPFEADRVIRSPNHGARSGLPVSLVHLWHKRLENGIFRQLSQGAYGAESR